MAEAADWSRVLATTDDPNVDANKNNDFQYFSYLILFVLFMYMVILALFLCVRRNQIRTERDLGNSPYNEVIEDEYCAAYRIKLTTKFEQIVNCSFGSSLVSRSVLLSVRLVFFLYFFIVGAVINGAEKFNAFIYFENWCALLVMLYFLLASICSIISIHTERSRSEVEIRLNAQSAWTLKVRVFGVCTHLLFEVAGGTSFFVIVMVQYIHGPASGTITIVHYLSFLAMAVEMMLNTVRVRFDQYPACIAWLVFYLLVIWPCVFTGAIVDWPYQDMSTGSANCFRNYLLVFVLNFCFYLLWYFVYKMKKLCFVARQRYAESDAGSEYFSDDGSSVASGDSRSRSGRGGTYSAYWDNGDDFGYPPLAAAFAAPQHSHNRSLNLQPMGNYHPSQSSAASVSSGTNDQYSTYSGRPAPVNISHVNRSLNLNPLNSHRYEREASNGSTSFWETESSRSRNLPSQSSGSFYYTENPNASSSGFSNYNDPQPPSSARTNRSLDLNPMGAYHRGGSNNGYGQSSGGDGYDRPPLPPTAAAASSGRVSHDRGLDLHPMGAYHRGDSSNSYGDSSANTSFSDPPPAPAPAPANVTHNRTLNLNPIGAFFRGSHGGQGQPSGGGGNTYHQPPPAPAPAPARSSHNRTLNLNPISTYHKNDRGSSSSNTYNQPPPAPPAATEPATGSSTGIRFPGTSRSRANPNAVDRHLNLNPINRYHNSAGQQNSSRQFSNTDGDLDAFAGLGESADAYDVYT